MRNLSFALTTRQMRDRSKTVTRRKGTWWARVLRPGDLVCAVEKSQGIRKGGLVRLGTIRGVSVREMPLEWPDEDLRLWDEAAREGVPDLSWNEFVAMFCVHMKCAPSDLVTRIEFEHVDEAAT